MFHDLENLITLSIHLFMVLNTESYIREKIEYNIIKFQIHFENFFIEELDSLKFTKSEVGLHHLNLLYHWHPFFRLYLLGILCYLLKYSSSIL